MTYQPFAWIEGKWIKKPWVLSDNPVSTYRDYSPTFTHEFRESVRDAFDRKCVECGKPENGYRLDVHHVGCDKKDHCDDPRAHFVALCRSCHMKAHRAKDVKVSHFMEIINAKCGTIGGKCMKHDHTDNGEVQA